MQLDAAAREALDGHLARALAALRDGDFPGASRGLDAAADVAAGAADATERVSRWRLLHEYARAFPRHRDEALEAAGAGRDYAVGTRRISVVEADDRRFVYRERGRNISVPRADIPADILLAIVESWFAGADQAGNHMLLGAYHVVRPRPDLAAARAEWSEAARRGEPTGRTLLPLLDDPVVQAVPDR